MPEWLTLTRALAVLAVLVLVLGVLQVRSCQHDRRQAAESRLKDGQAGAAIESGRDAIATQGAAAKRETAAEELTRTNSEEIHNAEGANVQIPPAVTAAGLRSLCRRAAYSSSERCRMLNAGAR